jgi:hypothetical protein
MKPIELTQEHKSKLLEMCNKLFPQYQEIDIEIEDNYEGTQDYVQLIKKCKITIYIHWFEFCMTHLVKKLKVRPSLLENRAWSTLELTGSKFRLNHPIDYLYEEFKKLK